MLTLKINGKSRKVDADPDMPLLWVLRDLLGMNGTKFGCGVALCGACTVHVDGIPRRSCVMPVSAAVGHSTTSIEGIGASEVARGFKRPGSTWRSCSAVIASPARSWPLQRSSRRSRPEARADVPSRLTSCRACSRSYPCATARSPR
jgi:succinate dehydrogenase/fumarate reductase-like Fe-S protein